MTLTCSCHMGVIINLNSTCQCVKAIRGINNTVIGGGTVATGDFQAQTQALTKFAQLQECVSAVG